MGASALLGGGAKKAFERNTVAGGLISAVKKKKQVPPSGNMGGFGPQPAAGSFLSGSPMSRPRSFM